MARWISISAVLVVVTGCGQGVTRPPLTNVTGTVTFKGQPLEQGQITFLPADGRSAQGKIVKGQITEVSTFDPHDGAPLGANKVIIVSLEDPHADMYKPSKSLIPAKYADPEKSGLTADLKPGVNDVKFELTE